MSFYPVQWKRSLWMAFFLVLAAPGCLLGQEFRATLGGQVSDPSGAAVAHAQVTAINQAMQVNYKTRTSSFGRYYLPYLLPGTYTVQVQAPGFKTALQKNVVLFASRTTGLNFKLQIGSVRSTVQVTSTEPLLNTISGSSGTVLSQRLIRNLPTDGRQIYMDLSTTPGNMFLQQTFGASGYSGTRGWDVSNNYSLGGAVQGYQNFSLNGSNITMMTGFGSQGTWMTAPNVDALQEVNVMENTYNARYGHTGGGSVNMVVKSGTDRYHGDIYDYMENGSALDANNFENNYSGIHNPNYIQHQYGGTFGGPIKRGKMFFFGSFEGYYENIPFTTLTTVPPGYLRPQMSGGQVTGGVDFTPSGYLVYDPATTVCTSKGGSLGNCKNNAYSRTEFPNDTIPANRIDPTSAMLLNLFPLPNTNLNSLTNNYITTSPDKYRYYQPMARFDYVQSPNTRWYALFEYQRGTEFRDTSGFTGPAMRGDINTWRRNIVFTPDMTHVFSPTMVGDFKLTFARFRDKFPDGPLNTPTPNSIGLNMPYVGTMYKSLLPQIDFNGYPSIIGNSFSSHVDQNLILDGDFTKNLGNQTLEWGGEWGWYYFSNPGDVGRPNGHFHFGTTYSQKNPKHRGSSTQDGNAIADLLLGYPDGGGVDWNSTLAESFPITSMYGQDNLHLFHRLTLQLGLRYDIEGGVTDRYNRLNRGMCLGCVNPIAKNSTFQSNLVNPTNVAAWQAAGIDVSKLAVPLGGIIFPGVNGQPRNAYNIDWGNLAPRVGFAYEINNKTVIRGGWGWMFAYGIEAGTRDGFSIGTPYTDSLNGGVTPTDYFQSGTPFPYGANQPLGATPGLLTAIGNTANLDFPQRKIPRSTIVSLGIQRALPGNMLLSLKYSGNHSRALRTQGVHTWVNGTLPYDLNMPGSACDGEGYNQLQQYDYDPCVAGNLNAQVPNPYYGVVPINTTMGSSKTVSAAHLMVPYSEFNLVGDYTNPYGRSQYDSLQTKLEKRFSQGLSMRVAYTFSKNMCECTFLNGWPWQDPNPVEEPLSYDRTHVFSWAGVWSLPIGHGKWLWGNPGAFGKAIDGWELSWVFSDSSGTPQGLPNYWYSSKHSFVPDSSFTAADPWGGNQYAEWLYNCAGVPGNCWQSVPSWGQRDLPDRIAYLRNPYTPNLDASISKSFQVSEGSRLKFIAEATNLTNSVLFGGPNTNPRDCKVYTKGGPCYAPYLNSNGQWAGFGTIRMYQQNFPRRVQIALKYIF